MTSFHSINPLADIFKVRLKILYIVLRAVDFKLVKQKPPNLNKAAFIKASEIHMSDAVNS